MKVTILTDNISGADLKGEWGLSVHVEYQGKRFLLDSGASGLFLENAKKLGIDIAKVDASILSHAHYDHSGGLTAFFSVNHAAPVYMSANAAENCYGGFGFLSKYIGIPKGVLSAFPQRIERVEKPVEISPGVLLVPHSTPGLEKLGRRNHLLVRNGLRYRPDDFLHELTLVFRTDSGLVIMNSCSHSGPEVIVEEVLRSCPGQRIAAYIGGLHLFRMSDREVEGVAEKLQACGIARIYTGHCTGQRAFDILQKRFGDSIQQLHCGMVIDL